MNTRLLRHLLLVCTLSAFHLGARAELRTCPAIAQHIVSTQAQYSVTHNQIPGQLAVSTHTLSLSGKRYKLESESKATGFLAMLYSGSLSQRSEGEIDPQLGFVPTLYVEKRGEKEARETVLDPSAKEVVFKKNDTRAPYEKGMQDRLSMIYELGAMLSCAGKVSSGDKVPLRVVSTGRVSTERFKFMGEEPLTVNWGKGSQSISTLRFESELQSPGDEKVRVWFAPGLKWVTVQIQIEDDKGKQLTQTLVGLKTAP